MLQESTADRRQYAPWVISSHFVIDIDWEIAIYKTLCSPILSMPDEIYEIAMSSIGDATLLSMDV